jgi:hypothetical protein
LDSPDLVRSSHFIDEVIIEAWKSEETLTILYKELMECDGLKAS